MAGSGGLGLRAVALPSCELPKKAFPFLSSPLITMTLTPLFPPIFFFIFLLSVAAEFETISLGNPFNDSSRSHFNIMGNARIDQKALQLTTDTSFQDSFIENNTGRIIYTKPYKIWEEYPDPSNSSKTSKRVFSFSSSFVFMIFQVHNKTVGEGLAFVIVPDSKSIPDYSYGEFLGLTNSTMDGHPNNQFVAVEFDTLKQSYDPDSNHIGLDINSVRSKAVRSLSEINVTLASLQGKEVFYQAWVDYSGPLGRIEVYLSEANKSKPDLPLLGANIDLSEYLAQESYFGFSGSTGLNFQLNCVLSWSLHVEILPDTPKNKISSNPLSLSQIVGICIAFVLLVLGVLFLGFCISRRRRTARAEQVEMHATLTRYEYQELKEATEDFSWRNRLGRGGSGEVYKGRIRGENRVAVKRFFDRIRRGDLHNELTVISRLHHRKIVPLLGWCHENERLFLVYEFMPNGSLHDLLFGRGTTQPLPWNVRKTILTDVAHALDYIHNGCRPSVLHRDLKAANIMLDANFKAKLGDFGLARVIESGHNSHNTENVGGTLGYMAPEYVLDGRASPASDVYGFGVLMLEVICQRMPIDRINGTDGLISWVRNLSQENRILDAVDQRLYGNDDREEAQEFLNLGLRCCDHERERRPRTREIFRELDRDAGNDPSFMSEISEESSMAANHDVETTPHSGHNIFMA